MKITINTTTLSREQMKFLSQLGEFRDDQTWEAECEPQEFLEAVELLRNAGVNNLDIDGKAAHL